VCRGVKDGVVALVDSLKSVVTEYPQARLVAFADMSSRMVLCSAGGEDLTQESFDALCRDAVAGFAEPLSSLATEAFGDAYGAITIDPGGVKLFLRSEVQSDDVLCCICDHSIDLDAFVARIRATLDEINAIS
jgi:hypothetical protein